MCGSPLATLARLPNVIRRRLTSRGDTEHEQALVRIAIVGGLVIYALLGPMPDTPRAWWIPGPVQLALFVFAVSLVHFAWIVAEPRVHAPRRGASMLVDHAGIVLGMAIGGASTALLYPLLLWVTLGHGFRYGSSYLILSALISVTLFGVLVAFSPYWQGLWPFNVGLGLALILIPGYCLRLLSQLHDARQRAEASSEAKSRFLATMSHELRTPLHAILGMTELLRGTELRPEQREMARTIHGAGHGLLNLIEDVLDIARIEAGADRLANVEFDVHRLALDVRDLLDHEARRKGLVLRLRLAPSLRPHMVGPRRAVYQILVNLVANAIKFTEAGTVDVSLARRVDGGGAGWLHLVVEDTGVGIPEAARSRIFESFAQADDGVTRRYGGSGLGLAIVKRLAETAGGSIRLEIPSGGGSRFLVALPVGEAPGSEAPDADVTLLVQGTPNGAQTALLDRLGLAWHRGSPDDLPVGRRTLVDVWIAGPDGKLPSRRCGRDLLVLGADDAPGALACLPAEPGLAELRRMVRAASLTAEPELLEGGDERVRIAGRSLDVLVADDHQVNQQVLERLLARAGHRVVVVGDGTRALERLQDAHFDVAILDLNMPGRGGLDVATALRDAAERPRLLALSADATPTIKAAARAAGFDAYLTKPVEGWRLLAELEGLTTPSTNEHAAPPPPTVALDIRRLDMLLGLDDEDGFAASVIDAFIEDGEALVVQLRRAAGAGDVPGFRDAAHALRSAATHLGATDLFARCLDTKRLGDGTLRERAVAVAEDIARTFEATAAALRAFEAKSPLSAAPGPPAAARADGSGSGPAAPFSAGPAAPTPAHARSTAR